MKHALALVAIVIAAISLVMSLRDKPVRVAESPWADESARLVARVVEIEKRLASIEQRAEAPRLEAPVVSAREVQTVKPDGRLDELVKRVEQLERAAVSSARGDPNRASSTVDDRLGLEAMIEAATTKAREPGASEAQKLDALRKLRGIHRPDGTDARVEVLDDLIRMAQLSQDGATRADVWRQMSGVNDPRLRQPLLDALAFDPHPKAREEAAETLAGFMPHGTVEAALTAASVNDADEGVRRQAKASLALR